MLVTVDIADPNHPVTSGSVPTGHGPISVFADGDYIYTANYNGNFVNVFDAHDPALPLPGNVISTYSNPQNVSVSGHNIFVAIPAQATSRSSTTSVGRRTNLRLAVR